MKMPVVDKKEWIDALLSGKFPQGRYKLNDGVSFCCLGVLCEVVKDRFSISVDESTLGNVTYNNDVAVLPVVLTDKYKTDSMGFDVPRVEFSPEEINMYGLTSLIGSMSISILNDKGVPFSRIAQIVEKYVEVAEEQT